MFIRTNIITASILFLINAGLSAQQVSSYACKWHPGLEPGNEESMVNQMQFNEKSQFLFMVANDEKNLYVDLMVADRAAVQKILKYGLTTWFNPEAKHKKALGIEFPVTSEGMSEPPYMREKGGGDRKEMRMAIMASKNQEMTLIGFDGTKERRSVNPGNDASFQGKVDMMEGGKLHVSLVLPLEKLGRGNPEALNEPISLGFETGYMDLTRQGGMPSGGGPESGGGGHGGGMYGGGMPGGGPPPQGGGTSNTAGGADQQQRPDISELSSPSKLWIKQATLAKKP